MSADNNNEITMNSVYLDTFRKRKNKLLASEIIFEENSIPSGARMSANSVYLETFRRRKNKQLASELNISEEPADSLTGEGITAQSAPKMKEAVEHSFSVKEQNHASQPRGRFHNSPRTNGQSSIDTEDAGSVRPVAFSSEKNNVPASEKSSTPVRTKKKSRAKIAIIMSLLVLLGCGIFLLSQRNKETDITETPDIPDDTWTESAPANSEVISPSEYTVSSAPAESTAADRPTTAATTQSTVPSSSETTATTAPAELRALRPGMENDDVLKMQKRLAELGYITQESCTGFYGDYTKNRVKLFQKNAGINETGIADLKTLKRLYADDAPKK